MGLELLSEVEVSIDYLYDKKYNDIPREVFDKVLDADPKYNGKQPSNYTQWMVNLIRKNELKSEDIYKVKEYLPLLIQNKNRIEKKDINQIKSVQDLYATVKKFMERPDENMSNSAMQKEIKKGAKKVYEDEEWIVIVPETKEASCYYGKGTQWCTAASNDDYKDNMFDHYNKYGPLYININKKSGRKYQMNFPDKDSGETVQVMDETDTPVEGNVIRKIEMTDGLIKFYEDTVGWVVKVVLEDFYESMSFPEPGWNGFYEIGNFMYTPDNGEMIDYYNLGQDYTIEKGQICYEGQPFAVCPIKYDSPKELEEKDLRFVDRGFEYTLMNLEGGNSFVVVNDTGEIPKDMKAIEYSYNGGLIRRGNDIINLDDEVEFTLPKEWGKFPVKTVKFLGNGKYVQIMFSGNQTVTFISDTGELIDLKELGSRHFAVNGYGVNRSSGENDFKLPDSFDGNIISFLHINNNYYKLNGHFYNKNGEEVSKEQALHK